MFRDFISQYWIGPQTICVGTLLKSCKPILIVSILSLGIKISNWGLSVKHSKCLKIKVQVYNINDFHDAKLLNKISSIKLIMILKTF